MIDWSKEVLWHFKCSICSRWWTVGDPPKEPTFLYCPFCGSGGDLAHLPLELRDNS